MADLEEQFSLFVRGGDGIEVSSLGTVLRALGLNPTQASVAVYENSLIGTNDLPLLLISIGKGNLKFADFLPIYNSIKAKNPEGSEEDFVEGMLFGKIESEIRTSCF